LVTKLGYELVIFIVLHQSKNEIYIQFY
jgi:hypothetical protein